MAATFFFFHTPSVVFALTPPLVRLPDAQESSVELVANVNFDAVSTSTSADGGISISFQIGNKLGRQSGIVYGVFVRSTKTGVLFDSFTSDEIVELGEGESAARTIVYHPPKVIPEESALYLSAYTQTGLPLAVYFVGIVPKSINGVTCNNDNGIITCKSKEPLVADIVVKSNSPHGAIVLKKKVDLPTNSKIDLVEIMDALPPGHYVVGFVLSDKEGTTRGVFGTDYLKTGAIAQIVQVSPRLLAPSQWEVKVFSEVSPELLPAILRVKMNECDAAQEYPLKNFVMTFTLTSRCTYGTITASLMGSTTVLDTLTVPFGNPVNAGSSKDTSRLLIVLTTLFFLVMVGVGFWYISQKKKTPPAPMTYVLLLIFFGSGFVFVKNANAATFIIGGTPQYNTCLTGSGQGCAEPDTTDAPTITGSVTVPDSAVYGSNYLVMYSASVLTSANTLCSGVPCTSSNIIARVFDAAPFPSSGFIGTHFVTSYNTLPPGNLNSVASIPSPLIDSRSQFAGPQIFSRTAPSSGTQDRLSFLLMAGGGGGGGSPVASCIKWCLTYPYTYNNVTVPLVSAPPQCAAPGWSDGVHIADVGAGNAPNFCTNVYTFGRCTPVPNGITGGNQASTKGSVTNCCYDDGDANVYERTCLSSALPQTPLGCGDGVTEYWMGGMNCMAAEPVLSTCPVGTRVYRDTTQTTRSCAPMNSYSYTDYRHSCVVDASCSIGTWCFVPPTQTVSAASCLDPSLDPAASNYSPLPASCSPIGSFTYRCTDDQPGWDIRSTYECKLSCGVSTPTLSSPTATGISGSGATLGATIVSDGGSSIIERGTCWGTAPNPTTNCLAEGGTAVSAFSHARSGMPAGTLIYYRGYARNAAGTGYSPDGTFSACGWVMDIGDVGPPGKCTTGAVPPPDPSMCTPPNNGSVRLGSCRGVYQRDIYTCQCGGGALPPPVFSAQLSASTPVNYNTAPTLTWAVSPATSCELSTNGGAFTPLPGTSGPYTPPAITADTAYEIRCYNGASGPIHSGPVTVNVRPQITVTGLPATVSQTAGPWPTMDFSATTNATQCWWSRGGTGDPAGNWTDAPIVPPQSWSNLGNGWNPGTYSYSFRCQSAGGATTEVSSGPWTLTVNPPAPLAGTDPVTGFVDIGNFLVGIPSNVSNAFRIVNVGDPSSSLTVNTIIPSSGNIACTTCGPSGALVAPGGSYPVDLAVNLPTQGSHDVILTANTSAGNVTMQVHADAELPFQPTSIDFGRIIAGSFGSTTIKILNLVNQSSLTVPGGTFTFKDPNPSHAPTRPADYVFMCWNSTTASWATSCPYQAIGPGGTIRDGNGNPFQIRFAPVRPERFQNRGEISAYPTASITLDGWGATGKIRFQER